MCIILYHTVLYVCNVTYKYNISIILHNMCIVLNDTVYVDITKYGIFECYIIRYLCNYLKE